MIDFLYGIMTGKRRGALVAPLALVLSVLAAGYGAAIALRRLLYALRIFRRRRVPMTVVSVGNLTLGGTGKTPFTIALSRLIETRLRRSVAVVIRGYGWDEQTMLRKNLADIPVMVGEDRARSCEKAIRLYGAGTAVLDDGFQHWELARDLDIVLVDSANPFGNGRLFPRGILREPRSALRRAHVIVLTKTDMAKGGRAVLREELSRLNPGALVIEARHRPRCLYDKYGREEKLDLLKGKRLLLVSSIADPSSFAATAASLGANIAGHVIFGDHHDYRSADIGRVVARAATLGPDAVLTTEKDAVKLQRMGFSFGSVPAYVCAVDMDIIGEEDLLARLRRLYSR